MSFSNWNLSSLQPFDIFPILIFSTSQCRPIFAESYNPVLIELSNHVPYTIPFSKSHNLAIVLLNTCNMLVNCWKWVVNWAECDPLASNDNSCEGESPEASNFCLLVVMWILVSRYNGTVQREGIKIIDWIFISSKLKTQVSYFDDVLSAICLSVCKLFTLVCF